jgi:beta-galactosidase
MFLICLRHRRLKPSRAWHELFLFLSKGSGVKSLNDFMTQVDAMCDELFVTKRSPYTVAETIARLVAGIQSKGLTIFAQIDHAANARDVNMTMNDAQLILFGSPKVGTMLMNENIFLAFELPLKIAVMQDPEGIVWVRYSPVTPLKARYQLKDAAIVTRVDALLDSLTEDAIRAS